MENIDPFHGEKISVLNAIAQLFGMCTTDSFNGAAEKIYGLLLLFMAAALLFLWGFYLCKTADERKTFNLLFVGLWFFYELYFRITKYCYGEYKHLMSGTVLLLILSIYAGYHSVDSMKGYMKKSGWVVYGLIGCLLLTSGLYKIKDNLIDKEFYYYDQTLIGLEEAARIVPATEAIGIGGTPASIHGMVYALKNSPAIILSNYISYFPYSQEACARYRLYEGDYREHEESMNEKFIWGNDRFYLIENTGLQTAFYTGFHSPEVRDDVTYYDTCDKEASILVYNYSDEAKCFSAAFQTEHLTDKVGALRVIVNGETVADGLAGEYIFTDMMMLNPGEKIRIYFYYDGELSEWMGKTVGYSIKDFKLVVYADE